MAVNVDDDEARLSAADVSSLLLLLFLGGFFRILIVQVQFLLRELLFHLVFVVLVIETHSEEVALEAELESHD